MADPKPELLYSEMTGDRDRFLGYAEEVAKIFAPTLQPKGTRIDERPWTSDGMSALSALTSQTMKIMMPVGVQWHQIDLPPYVWDLLKQRVGEGRLGAERVEALRQKLRQRTVDNLNSLGQKNTRPRLAASVRRNLVEGNTVCNNTDEGLRIFPLRSFVCRRNAFGTPDFLVVKEHVKPGEKGAQSKEEFHAAEELYTFVDYTTDEVWQQKTKQPSRKVESEGATAHWFCFTTEMPDQADYAVGYAYNYLGLASSLNHADASLAEAMSYASWNPWGLREGSTLSDDPDAVAKKKSGDPLVMQDGDIIWPNKGGKIADWSFIAGVRSEDRKELAAAFAKGIKDRPFSADASATAILQIIDELNTETQDLLGAYEDTLQRPLARSEYLLHEAHTPLFTTAEEKILQELLVIVIATGISALDKQRTMSRFVLQLLPMVMKLDNRVRANGGPILERVSEGMLVNTDGLYETKSPQELQMEAMLATMSQMRGGGGGGEPQVPTRREETIMTRGGPQPPQPPQPVPVAG